MRLYGGIRAAASSVAPPAGALDSLTTNLAGAYSFDRRLVSTFAGNAFRVTETGGSTAANIGFGSDGRYNQSALLSHAGANDALLDTLYDQSVNARNIIHNGGSKFHLVDDGGYQSLNGRLLAKVLTAGGLYSTATFTAYTGTTMSGYFAVIPAHGSANERHGLSFVKNTLADYNLTTSMSISRGSGNETYLQRNGGNGQSVSVIAGMPHVIMFRCDGSTGSIYTIDNLNGVMTLAVSSAFDINRFLLLGVDVASSEANVNYCVMEMAVWFSDIGASALAAAADNAAAYYGTWGTLQALPTADTTIPDTSYARPATAVRYVATTGSDGAAGTQAAPWATLSKVNSTAVDGDTIIFRQGLYRDGISGSMFKNLTFQPYPHEQVWFSGADVVTGWVSDSGRWRKDSWPRLFLDGSSNPAGSIGSIGTLTIDEVNYPLAGYADQVWIDDVPLTQVGTLAACVPGTFFVDYTTTKGYIGNDPTGKTVEAAVRSYCFNLEGGTGTPIVRGLGFKRYGSYHVQPNVAAVRANKPNVRIERCSFTENSYEATAFYGVDCIIRDSKLSYSGKNGIGAYQAHRLLVERCRITFCNQQNFDPGWDAAGAKIVFVQTPVVRDCIFDDNRACGLWFDIACTDIIVTRNYCRRNISCGMSIEQSHRSTVVSNWVSDNLPDLVGPGIGVYIFESNVGSFYNNTIVNNDGYDMKIGEQNRTFSGAEAATGADSNTHDWDLRNNVIVPKNASSLQSVWCVDHRTVGEGAAAATNFFLSWDHSYYLLPASPGAILIRFQTGPTTLVNYATLAAFVAAPTIPYEDNGISATAASLPAYTTGLTTTNGFTLSSAIAAALNSGMAQPIYAASAALPRGALHLGWGAGA